ncbi:hypothetical protein [Cupriavidus numazuensis]|uniref:PLAT domain-containing protein n=1 Tax=Cupriavidus numazuensis TaxID=221992 RepID=A0ABN7Q2M1_9BURK|nr:hypothetical protein [Cupriavidus numazuensis]CAG2154777.1 hypothetical protein LMG26411_04719 [Cupriavidus numazuensis]
MAYHVSAVFDNSIVRAGSSTNIILRVSVTDENGHGVRHLNKGNFRILDFMGPHDDGLFNPAYCNIESFSALDAAGQSEFDREACSGYYTLYVSPAGDWWQQKTLAITVQILEDLDVKPGVGHGPGHLAGAGATFAYCHTIAQLTFKIPEGTSWTDG